MTKSKTNKNSGNIPPILVGLTAGIVTVVFLNELAQALVAMILGAGGIQFSFSDFNFHALYSFPVESGWVYPLFSASASVLFVIAALKLSTTVLIKSKMGAVRFFAIFYQLLIAGYLLISVFYGAFVVTLKAPIQNDWLDIVNIIGLEDYYRALFMFAMIALTALYLQALSRRIKIYIGDHKK